MAGKRKTRPKGFDPEVWSLLSDETKGRKDLNKTQKSVYAMLLAMSFRYTKTDGWFWHRLDDVLTELDELNQPMSKSTLQRVLAKLVTVGLIGYRPGSNIGGRNIASYFKVFENQVVELKNDTPYLSSGLTTTQNSGYIPECQAVGVKNDTPYPCNMPITPENTHYYSGYQTVETKNDTPSDRNIIEVTENQGFMEKMKPLNEVKLKEKKKNYKDPKETTVLRDTFVEQDTIPADAHASEGVGKDFSFSSSSQDSKPVVVDRMALDKEHENATLMYRAGKITFGEYSDITFDLLQSLSDDDEMRSSTILYRYDLVVERLGCVTEEEAQSVTVRGRLFKRHGNKLIQRVRQGEFSTNVQGAWLEMKEALKWLNGLHYTHNGVILKAYSGTRDEDYQRWKRLCVNALGRTEGEKFAACIPTPNKWN